MINPENRPTSRIFPDGRRMPTVEGLRHSQSTKNLIAEKTRRPKSQEQVVNQSVVWERVRPFAEQRLSVSQIVTETGLKREQVHNAVYRRSRPKWHQVQDYSNPETANERRSKALKGKPKSAESNMKRSVVWREIGPLYFRGALVREIVSIAGVDGVKVRGAQARNNRRSETARVEPFGGLDRAARMKKARKLRETLRKPLSENEKKDLKFAQELFKAGFVTFDIKIWEKLHELYGRSKRLLPESFAKCLRLEVFLSAIEQAKKGEVVLLGQYREIGKSIDPKWFNLLAQEEGFIKAKLLTDWADGEDENGFFRLNGEGEKTRHTDIIEGIFVNYNSALAIRRLRMRVVNGRNGNGNEKERPRERDWSDKQHPFDR